MKPQINGIYDLKNFGTGKQKHNQIVKNPFIKESETDDDQVIINPFSPKLFVQNKKPIKTGGP